MTYILSLLQISFLLLSLLEYQQQNSITFIDNNAIAQLIKEFMDAFLIISVELQAVEVAIGAVAENCTMTTK